MIREACERRKKNHGEKTPNMRVVPEAASKKVLTALIKRQA